MDKDIDMNKYFFEKNIRPFVQKWVRNIAKRYSISEETKDQIVEAKLNRLYDAAPDNIKKAEGLTQLLYIRRSGYLKDFVEKEDFLIINRNSNNPYVIAI